MDTMLLGFVRALRAAGAEPSPAETIDAARTLALMGYSDRGVLKDSLGVVLAKSATEKHIHDQVFDQYFARLAPQRADEAKATGAAEGAEGGSADADNDADPSQSAGAPAAATAQPLRTGAPEVDALLALAQPGEPHGTRLAAALDRAARDVGVDDIRFATQMGYYTGRVMQALGAQALEARLRAHLLAPPAARTPQSQAEAAALQQAQSFLQRSARALVAQRFELYGRPATESFLSEVVVNRPMGRMAPADMDRLKVAVQRMSRRLAARHSRRRRVKLHGQLDFRRTLRDNAGHDGVPVALRFKYRRRDRPRIVAICDVSGSVASHVRFLLLFLYALQGAVDDLRSFAFSDRLKDVSPALAKLPFDDAMALILKELGGGSTDYGQALVDFQDQHWQMIDRRTTVLVLGDGRSNQADPRLDIFSELADRAKRVLWLCPEPAGRWGTGDSCMLQYQPFCSQLSHCATAADLERAIDNTLQAYG